MQNCYLKCVYLLLCSFQPFMTNKLHMQDRGGSGGVIIDTQTLNTGTVVYFTFAYFTFSLLKKNPTCPAVPGLFQVREQKWL